MNFRFPSQSQRCSSLFLIQQLERRRVSWRRCRRTPVCLLHFVMSFSGDTSWDKVHWRARPTTPYAYTAKKTRHLNQRHNPLQNQLVLIYESSSFLYESELLKRRNPWIRWKKPALIVGTDILLQSKPSEATCQNSMSALCGSVCVSAYYLLIIELCMMEIFFYTIIVIVRVHQ